MPIVIVICYLKFMYEIKVNEPVESSSAHWQKGNFISNILREKGIKDGNK